MSDPPVKNVNAYVNAMPMCTPQLYVSGEATERVTEIHVLRDGNQIHHGKPATNGRGKYTLPGGPDIPEGEIIRVQFVINDETYTLPTRVERYH